MMLHRGGTSLTLATLLALSGNTFSMFPLDFDRTPDHTPLKEWTYADTEGWCAGGYPMCCGPHQSPIDLDASVAMPITFPKLKFSKQYFQTIQGHIMNNGHSAQFSPDDPSIPEMVTGGPLYTDCYQFEQFHFHWGHDDNEGSEHWFNGQRYQGELHLVHRNTKYSTIAEAAKHKDGLAVIGMFLAAGLDNPDNHIIQQVDDALSSIKKPNSTASLSLNLGEYLEDLGPFPEYFAYKGSLTTPGCNEAVTWIVFVRPINIAEHQIETFRHIRDHFGHLLQDNFRPPQPLNDRIVFLNVPPVQPFYYHYF